MTVEQIVRDGMDAGAAQKPDEFADLVRLISGRRPRVVLEIGTMHGGTLRAWCACATPAALIISVDLPGGEWGGGYAETDIPRLEGYAQPGQRLVLVRGDSHDQDTHARVSETLDGREVEFLFIDGDHTLSGVRADFEQYTPLVAPGGLVAFHDILPHPQVPGCDVDRFWNDEIRGRYKTWEFCVDGDERGYGPWGGIGALKWENHHAGG